MKSKITILDVLQTPVHYYEGRTVGFVYLSEVRKCKEERKRKSLTQAINGSN